MSFINLNLGDDVQESKAAPNGRYDLVVSNVEQTESREKKTPQLKVTINIEGHDEFMPVNHYVPLASNKDEPKSAAYKQLLLKRFLTLFKVPFNESGFDPEEMVGCKATAELQQGEPNANGDIFNNLVVPRLSTEAAAPAARVAAGGKKS